MTEEQAKTKWCPMVRTPALVVGDDIHRHGTCIGSDCMMWRWDTEADPRHGLCGLADRVKYYKRDL